MKLVFLAHPVRGDIQANLNKARSWFSFAASLIPGIVPVMNWIIECEVFADHNVEQRAASLARSCALATRCDELWLCGEDWTSPSEGMRQEADAARATGVLIFDFMGYSTTLGLAEQIAQRHESVIAHVQRAGRLLPDGGLAYVCAECRSIDSPIMNPLDDWPARPTGWAYSVALNKWLCPKCT